MYSLKMNESIVSVAELMFSLGLLYIWDCVWDWRPQNSWRGRYNRKSQNERLLEAVRIGDYDEVVYLVRNGANVNYQNRSGTTPLHNAVKYQRKEIVFFLVDKRADVTITDQSGNLPLTFAIENEDKEVVSILQNSNFETFRTILPKAVRRSSLDMIKFLIRLNASVIIFGPEGKTPLVEALEHNRPDEIINILLKNGASVEERDLAGYAPLEYFARKGKIDVVKRLIKFGANINRIKYVGMNPLAAAAYYTSFFNKLDVVKFLVEQGAIVNPSNAELPIICAIKSNNFNAVKYLVSVGASVNKTDKNDKCPLFEAVKVKNERMVQWLLDNGAHPSVHSVFLDVIFTENLKFFQLFVEKGVNINLKYKTGGTALLSAIDLQNTEIVKKLMEHGADVNLTDIFGKNPLLTAIELPNFEIVKILVEHNANVNAIDANGNLPLVRAITLDKLEVILLLLEHGADVNICDENGAVPFRVLLRKRFNGRMFVGKMFFDEVVKIFIKHGAHVNIISNGGTSLLTAYVSLDNFEMVQFLVNNGALVNQIDCQGKTPLEVAALNLNYQMFEYLFSNGGDIERIEQQLDGIANEDVNFAIFLENMRQRKEKIDSDQKGICGQESSGSEKLHLTDV